LRYVNLEGSGPEEAWFTGLYGIGDASDFPSILDRVGSLKSHPIPAREFATFSQRFGMSGHVANIYEQTSEALISTPLLESDQPLSIVAACIGPENETALDCWYTEPHVLNC